MKKRTRIFLGILILLLLAGAVVLLWQWSNIIALRQSYTIPPEEVQAQIETNRKMLEETMKQYQIPVAENSEGITEEMINQIISEELSMEEAAKDFLDQPSPDGSTTDGSQGGQTEPKPDDGSEQDAPFSSADAQIRIDLATLYILQAVYEYRLDAAIHEAAKAYSTDKSILAEKVQQLTALEDECDRLVYAIIVDIRAQLKASGQDNTLANKVETYYLSEKNLKKSQYVQKYRS